MADQIALLEDGRIRAIGRPRDRYTTPCDEPTARFLGTANLLPAKVIAGQLHCSLPVPIQVDGLADGAYMLLLRPEQLAITLQPTDHAAAATVTTVNYQGSTSEVRLQMQDDVTTELIVQTPGPDEIAVGQKVWVHATHAGVTWPEPPPPPGNTI